MIMGAGEEMSDRERGGGGTHRDIHANACAPSAERKCMCHTQKSLKKEKEKEKENMKRTENV